MVQILTALLLPHIVFTATTQRLLNNHNEENEFLAINANNRRKVCSKRKCVLIADKIRTETASSRHKYHSEG